MRFSREVSDEASNPRKEEKIGGAKVIGRIIDELLCFRALTRLRAKYRTSVTILPASDESEGFYDQCAIKLSGPESGWEDHTFYGATLLDALERAEAFVRQERTKKVECRPDLEGKAN